MADHACLLLKVQEKEENTPLLSRSHLLNLGALSWFCQTKALQKLSCACLVLPCLTHASLYQGLFSAILPLDWSVSVALGGKVDQHRAHLHCTGPAQPPQLPLAPLPRRPLVCVSGWIPEHAATFLVYLCLISSTLVTSL